MVCVYLPYNIFDIGIAKAQSNGTQIQDAQSKRSQLEQELAQLQNELNVLSNQLQNQKGQSASLNRDIAILNTKINQAKTDIHAKNVLIEKLGGEIDNKNQTIYSLSDKIERERESLAQLIKKSYEFEDQTSFVHVMMSDATLSEYYRDLDDFSSIQSSIEDSLGVIRGTKKQVEVQKQDLVQKQTEQELAKLAIEAAKKKVEATSKERAQELAISKGQEAQYQKVIADKERRKAEILSAIFSLANVSTKINFQTALSYANEAKAKTNIDPAFLLAILTQESNLGSNVGQCYLTDPKTGAGVGSKSGQVFPNVMKPMGLPGRKGDIDDFFAITSAVGRDPMKTLVSCPIPSAGGYGGAMGPAQFIPSTWGGYKSRLKSMLGHDADPWNPHDAFIASAMLLTDNGAVGNVASLQSKAACRYYGTGGATCSYGNSVLRLKAGIQANIDLIQGN